MRYAALVLGTTLAATVAGGSSAAVVGAGPTATVVLGEAGIEVSLPPVGTSGSFRASASAVLCDGSVRVATACDVTETIGALVSFVMEGSIFPYIEIIAHLVDYGTPTSFALSLSAPLSQIAGDATTLLLGSVAVPPDRSGLEVTPVPVIGSFFRGLVAGPGGAAVPSLAGVSGLLPDALVSKTETFGPVVGTFDCSTIGGCQAFGLDIGLNGLGGGGTYTLEARFDVDPVAPVPLPAAVGLLMGAVGLLGLSARRRRM